MPLEQWAEDVFDDLDKQERRGGNGHAKTLRFQLRPFEAITLSTTPNYLIKGILPRVGLAVVWGPPKCGKSFWTYDLAMHVALDRKYRGHKVRQGTVVYCALEGGVGFAGRVEAWRRRYLGTPPQGPVPFYLIDVPLDLVADRNALIQAIRQQAAEPPAVVVIDTLNRAMVGDENKSEDMAKFIRAADVIRTAFDCLVIIIHHCGVAGSRPRGHTSLAGADDAQIAIERDKEGVITVTVEHMKDGEASAPMGSKLERVELGKDDDGDPMSSCVIVPAEIKTKETKKKLPVGQECGLNALKTVIENGGRVQPPKGHPFDANWPVVESEKWRQQFYDTYPSDKIVTKRQALFRATLDLEKAGFIMLWKHYVAQRDSVT
jgi:AAA domain